VITQQGELNAYNWSGSASEDKLFYLTAMLENGLHPQRVMLPLLAVIFLSPLEHFLKAASCEPKFITALVGKTGTRKSTTAALMCSFFGNFTASTLPMSFHDTANSILSNIYSLKDVLTCVDDLHPNGVHGDLEIKNTAQNLLRFYCAHLMQNKPELIEYLAPQIAHTVEGYIMGTEQRVSRAIFKLAVEVGAQSHILAAINDIEDGTRFKLREMVTDEVRRINGIINFESAVRYQRSEEE